MSDNQTVEPASFTAMADGTKEEYARIAQSSRAFSAKLPDRVLEHLKLLDGDFGGYAVDRLTHSLQSATRAHRAGKDEEFVVCALLHDIGDTIACFNHADLAATMLHPFVSEENHWMVEKHGIFQGYYFFHHLGLDQNMRDQYQGHPHFEYCAQFCHMFDQNCFDPNYDTMPLEAFAPMVHRVMEKPKRSIYKPVAAAAE